MADTEKDILSDLADGDIRALDILYMLYAPMVKNWCFSIVRNHEEARDLAQDIFLRVWNSRKQLKEVRKFRPYLFRITHNMVLNRLREQNLRDMFASSEHGAFKNMPPEMPDYDKRTDTEDLLVNIHLTIERMSDMRRSIFRKSRFEDKTYQEIAEEMGISPKTVQYHISRALADLRKLL